MNNLKTYFASPGKRRTNGTAVLLLPAVSATELSNSGLSDTDVDKVAQLETAKENGTDVEGVESTSPLYIIKKPSVDSKLILQNMEEVLNSVKKKHRQKHRRKKEQKKLAQLEAEAVAVAIKTKADQEIVTLKRDIDAALSKKPLSEKTEQVINGGVSQVSTSKSRHTPMKKNPIKSVLPNGNLLKNIALSPKINETFISPNEECEHTEDIRKSEGNVDSLEKSAKPNAFEVLMNARNKSIGANTPGKEMSAEEDTTVGEGTATTVKRKLLLQDWAERKGGAKRKLEEESRAAYVERQLETRAKRFKKMLVIGSGSKSVDNPIETPSPNQRNRKLNKKSTRVKLNIEENEAEKPKRTRGIIPRQGSASIESVEESSPPVSSPQDIETIDLLAQLSSPTKKPDSLLGYFPKKESLNVSENKKNEKSKQCTSLPNESDNTPKRPRRLAAKRTVVEVETPTKEPQSAQKGETTLNSATISDRPRRSCAGKARYDYDLQVSPTKLSKTPKNAKTPKSSIIHTSKPDEISDEELEVIDLVNKSDTSSEQKLAPLFVRSIPKPSPDPDLVKARHAFLMSGVPDKLRIEQSKQKQFEQSYEEALELFPKISHVQQLTADELKWVTETFSFSVKLKSVEDEPSISKNRHSKAKKLRDIRHITGSHEDAPFSFPPLPKQPLPQVPEKRLIIKAWKTKYERFPIYRCYNQMREKYRYFNAIDSAQDTEQVTESFVVTRRNSRRSLQLAEQNESDANSEDAKPPAMAPNGELMFTEKYKPLLFEQFLVNLSPVAELREFLANWSAGTRNQQGIDDIDFDDSNSSTSSQQALCNTVVLMGPRSSGKTSSVFAVANELNFNVLEINAGMKRTGKKLMQELQEATQSHQLRKNAPSQGKAQKSLLKMSLNGLKSKAKKSNSKSVNDGDNPSSPSSADSGSTVARKCLILIEDADIVFDQMDAGFTDAIYTLAASSKRPVIIVASDVNCPHLQRLIQQNTIYFKEPSTVNISRYMAVLALLENCPVNLDDLISLYIYNKKDLRKTLLELQFFTQSGGDRKKEQEAEQVAASLFASPNKRRFSEESSCLQGTDNDDIPNKETSAARSDADSKLYIHQNLFNFFTMPQNEERRIPFPVDFDLLRHNLDEILQSSRSLSDSGANRSDKRPKPVEPTIKRKSRSPKKVWLTAAAAQKTMPLADLCDFYENVSIACLLGTHGQELPSIEGSMQHFNDQLLPHLADDFAHSMVANAIDHNLEAQQFSYNLIYAPLKKISLVDCLGNVALRSRRLLALEVEPMLRSICRSEKLRATNERRSTRFYHYLRNNFTNLDERLEDACSIFMDDPSGSQVNCEEGITVDSTTSQ